MSEVKFSIILPTYNRRFCIDNAIASLLKQKYQDFEVIIIDDGSTDNTYNHLLNNYKEEIRVGKIKLFRNQNSLGVSKARNIGLKHASNNWIAYLDSDNYMFDDFLSSMNYAIRKYKKNKIFYSQIRYRNSKKIIGDTFNFERLLKFNYIDLGSLIHFYKLDLCKPIFNEELNRLVDWDFLIRITQNNQPRFIKKVLLSYCDDDSINRISNSSSKSIDINYQKIIISYWNNLSPERFFNQYNQIYDSYLVQPMLKKRLETLEKEHLFYKQSLFFKCFILCKRIKQKFSRSN